VDILDEIDAALTEKKSKWNYTPMREKSETDAIIDDLLREFSPEKESSRRRKASPSPRYYEAEVPVNEEVAERVKYEKAVASSTPNFDIPPVEDEEYIPQDLGADDFEYSDEYDEQEYAEESYEEYPDEDESYSPEDYPEEDYDEEDYDEEDYGEYDEDSLDDYDDSDDDDRNSGEDFKNFMDSENDGEKGDMPRYWLSGMVKTILKIAVVAVILILLILGGVKAYDMLKEKYGTDESVSQTDPLKAELQKVITPLVVIDVEDFADKTELKSEDYINIAVWEFIINGEIAAFTDEETGECRLPQQQMEVIINKLFGEVEFKHGSAGTDDVKIEYDKKNKEYVIPENTDIFSYSPIVTDISDTDPVYTVYADCYVSSPSWQEEKKQPDKRVMITLEKTSEYYNIVSQKTIPVE